MRTLARFVLPLIALLFVFDLAGCSSDGTTPSCADAAACMEPPAGGGYWVGYGGGSGNDAATGDEPKPEVEAGEDAEPTD